MSEDDPIYAYLHQFTLEQLEMMTHTVTQIAERKAEAYARRKAEVDKIRERRQRRTAGHPPSAPKDLNDLAAAAGLDISGLLKEAQRRSG